MASSNDNNSNKFTLPLKAPAASGAGLTPLPPSPEVKPAASQLAGIDPISFSLHGNTGVKKDPDPPSRLRSIAKYQAFSPQALACSDPIPASTFSATATLNGESNEDNAGVYLGGSQRRLVAPVRKEATSSLGAVAGAQGVAVFRVSKPHSPLMMLNHATANTTAGGGRPVTSLTFQPNPTTSLYLAAARGSGVLVWDVSGHSLSPLLGRLAMDSMAPPSSGTSTDSGLVTTSLSWKLSTERDGAPLLATTTKHSACIWDLRQPLSASKPSLRFGMSSRTKAVSNQSGISSPYVQVSCSRSSECALMDAAGTIRIFDIRMTDKSRYHTNGLASFTAFMHSGVGVSYMPWKDRTAWVTWGLDDPNSDAVVKVWSSSNPRDTVDASQKTALPEDYWYQDGSPDKSTGNGVMSHRLIAQCSPPYHLSCPRVCPGPVEHSIVTIGVFDDIRSKKGKDGWRADLWKLRPPTADENEANDGTFGMEKLVTFNGGANHDKYIGSALGKDSSIGQLRAAELAITSYNAYSSPSRKKGEDTMHENFSGDNEFGLVLCCLSEKGYVTTHVSLVLYNLLLAFLISRPLSHTSSFLSSSDGP